MRSAECGIPRWASLRTTPPWHSAFPIPHSALGCRMPDELDRLFELLVTGLSKDNRLAVPFPAADVYERLVPYRSNRSHLNVATHQDYEMAVLRLLSGERGYVQLEPENVREAMQREIATINPDPAYFRSFPEAQVMVNGRAAERA